MDILSATAQGVTSFDKERNISKPSIMGAPYDLTAPVKGEETMVKKTGLTAYEAYAGTLIQHNDEAATIEHQSDDDDEDEIAQPDPVQQVGAIILGFQRELETLQDNLAKMFKQMGHLDEWNRILKS
jgi:hypothetical protein